MCKIISGSFYHSQQAKPKLNTNNRKGAYAKYSLTKYVRLPHMIPFLRAKTRAGKAMLSTAE